MLDPQKSINIAHPDLGVEFHRRILLPSHNGTHPGLAETDDAIIDPGVARLVHLALLGIQQSDYRQPFTLPPGQGVLPFIGMILNHSINVLQIAAKEIELLFPGVSNASVGLFAALGESVVLLPGYDAVRSGFPAARKKRVYDPFCVLPRFVQQRCICWKANRLRRARRIQYQRAFVRLILRFRLTAFAAASCGTVSGIVVIFRFVRNLFRRLAPGDHIIDVLQHLRRQTLPETGHHT